MHKLHMLNIEFEHQGSKQTITPVLLADGKDVILVDCGYPGFLPLIEQAMEREGVALQSLTHLLLTHHDNDHMGTAAAIKRVLPAMSVLAHEIEAPYIEGKRKSARLEQAEAGLEELSGEARAFAEGFIRMLQQVEPAQVDRTLASGEKLPWCGGIEVVHTPGHMAGHISLYLPAARTLIAGDAVVIEAGKLQIANPSFTLDLKEAVRSVRKLLSYDVDQLICYHGGLFTGDVKSALTDLLEEYQPYAAE